MHIYKKMQVNMLLVAREQRKGRPIQCSELVDEGPPTLMIRRALMVGTIRYSLLRTLMLA